MFRSNIRLLVSLNRISGSQEWTSHYAVFKHEPHFENLQNYGFEHTMCAIVFIYLIDPATDHALLSLNCTYIDT
jgi:hypothetical protein